MWIKGRRRGGAKALADHLRRTDENESIKVLELSGFSFGDMTEENLEKALKQMEAIGYGKGNNRVLYHAIMAPAYGETLNAEQRKQAVDYYIEKMGFKGYQYALVEHWKKGKQHFHLAFNIIDPATGKIDQLKWTGYKEYQISRDLEQKLGLKLLKPQGKSTQSWRMQRGKRTGIDPRKLRKEVTTIFNTSMTAEDFVRLLDKKGLALTRGRRNQLVLVDKHGHTHGLMRLVEGKKLANLRRKFPELNNMTFKSHDQLVKERKATRIKDSSVRHRPRNQHSHNRNQNMRRASGSKGRSRIGQGFHAVLDKSSYRPDRTTKGLSVADEQGESYSLDQVPGATAANEPNKAGLSRTEPEPIFKIFKQPKNKLPTGTHRYRTVSSKTKAGYWRRGNTSTQFHGKPWWKLYQQRREQEQQQQFSPKRPESKGWPPAAIRDWQLWGYLNPARFFARWPELSVR